VIAGDIAKVAGLKSGRRYTIIKIHPPVWCGGLRGILIFRRVPDRRGLNVRKIKICHGEIPVKRFVKKVEKIH